MSERLLRATGTVALTIIAVLILAQLVRVFLPVLLLLALVVWMVATLLGWSRYRGY